MEAIGGLGTVEQPVKRLEDMAELARRLDTPIMADEAIYAPEDAIERWSAVRPPPLPS